MSRIGLADATPQDWAELAAFLFRRWFHHVWTMQEITLATHLEFRCGSYDFSWRMILHTVTLLSNPILSMSLFSLVGQYYGEQPIGIPFSQGVELAHRMHQVLRGGGLQSRFFEESKLFYSSEKLYNSPVVVLVFLASFLRSSGATDPRDKIFGLLGIMNTVIRTN